MRKLLPGVFMLDRTWGCNVYLLADRDRGPVLVDAGFPLDARRVFKAIGGTRPSLVVATHYHIDHVGTMARVKARFGAPVSAHSLDAEVMEGTEPYQVYRLDPLRAAYYRLLAPLYRYEYVSVDLRVEDGDVLPEGGLRVVHLPGHTSGSIALYEPGRRMLFSGDTLRNERGVLDGPPPQFTPDIEQSFRGIREKLLPLDFEVLLPGHGEPVLAGAGEALMEMMEKRKRAGESTG